jgi:membrane protein required for colicin V production
MQAYDLIMLVVLAMSAIFGAIKGFAWQVASLASIFVSYLVAVNFRFDLAQMIQAAPPWNQFLAMLILYVGTSFVIWVGFRLLSGAIDQVRLKEFDRHLGAAFGLAKGAIYCLLITMFAMTLLGPRQQQAICQSRSGYTIANALDSASGVLPKELHDVVGPYLASLDEKLHQRMPPAGSSQPTAGDGLWPTDWSSGSPAPAGTPVTSPEQGAEGGWNFWPSGAAPQPPALGPAPQNYPPLTLPPPSGSFSFDPSAAIMPNPELNNMQLPNMPPPSFGASATGTANPGWQNPGLPSFGMPGAGWSNPELPTGPALQQAQQPNGNWTR